MTVTPRRILLSYSNLHNYFGKFFVKFDMNVIIPNIMTDLKTKIISTLDKNSIFDNGVEKLPLMRTQKDMEINVAHNVDSKMPNGDNMKKGHVWAHRCMNSIFPTGSAIAEESNGNSSSPQTKSLCQISVVAQNFVGRKITTRRNKSIENYFKACCDFVCSEEKK